MSFAVACVHERNFRSLTDLINSISASNTSTKPTRKCNLMKHNTHENGKKNKSKIIIIILFESYTQKFVPDVKKAYDKCVGESSSDKHNKRGIGRSENRMQNLFLVAFARVNKILVYAVDRSRKNESLLIETGIVFRIRMNFGLERHLEDISKLNSSKLPVCNRANLVTLGVYEGIGSHRMW